MKRKLILIISILVILIANSCKDNGVSSTSGIKTPREMTWTSDTIYFSGNSQTLMENILVFSTNDIWVCGWGDVARGLIWHYNSEGWKESNIFADVGGMRVNDIAGSSSYDLWAAGYSGKNIFLGHYNGSKWTREDNMGIEGELLDMCKDDEGNIWACGRNGIILKYTDTSWKADTIEISHYSDAEYLLKSIECYEGKVYVLASIFDENRARQIYYYAYGDLDKWVLADSMVFDASDSFVKWGYMGLYSSDYKKLYSFGITGSWVYKNSNWESFYNSHASIYGMHGYNENYLFAVGDFQQALFYNGSVWDNFSDIFSIADPYFVFTNVWTNGYEAFIMGYIYSDSPMKSIIYHGK